MWKKIWIQISNHERYQSISVILCAGFILFLSSCESKTNSLIFPDKKVSYTELVGEINLLTARANSGIEDIQRQNALKADLMRILEASTMAGGFSWASMAAGVFGLLGSGALIDNFRKRKDVLKLETRLAERDTAADPL